jgi:hypothetical protein
MTAPSWDRLEQLADGGTWEILTVYPGGSWIR